MSSPDSLKYFTSSKLPFFAASRISPYLGLYGVLTTSKHLYFSIITKYLYFPVHKHRFRRFSDALPRSIDKKPIQIRAKRSRNRRMARRH